MALIGSESRDRLAADPSPRLRLGIFNGRQPARESLGRQWSRLPLYPTSQKQSAGPFPVSSTARTIGEQKAKVKAKIAPLLIPEEAGLSIHFSDFFHRGIFISPSESLVRKP
jgi:hypothetical protein